MPERRQHLRLRVTAPIRVLCLDTRSTSFVLFDLGSGGFSMRTPTEVPVGMVMRFRFSLPDESWAAVLSGQSVYCRPDPSVANGRVFLSGFKFLHPETPTVMAGINALIDHATVAISFS